LVLADEGRFWMDDVSIIEPTKEDKHTNEIKRRIRKHISEEWSEYADPQEYRDPTFDFYIYDHPYEIWSCTFVRKGRISEGEVAQERSNQAVTSRKLKEVTLWFLWNGEEITSFEHSDGAFIDLINEQKSRRFGSKVRFFVAPSTVCAGLALLLLCLITYLEVTKIDVPKELWTVFTAAISFYFGSGHKAARIEDA
jgi:hypothetical protein